MKVVRQIVTIIAVVCIIMAHVAMPASAVDPVSTATMANALAQAITAYGASHGVSMTFDVTNTNGIGEGMHKLWNNFKTYVNDNNVPTYDSLANTMWATIYTKIGNYIGININDTEMPYIDAFWNWLLSGPAEMTKIDNQYYEWTLNQNNTVDPIIVFNGVPFSGQPITSISGSNQVRFESGYPCFHRTNGGNVYRLFSYNNSYYSFFYVYDSNYYRLVYASTISGTNGCAVLKTSENVYDRASEFDKYCNTSYVVNGHTWYYAETPINIYNGVNYCIPEIVQYDTIGDGFNELDDIVNGGLVVHNSISVIPYIGDTIPQNVYIPDNEDVNYAPLPYVGGLDIPWDDSIFGDGTDNLTDTQSEAISGVIDDTIVDSLDKTLTLADTENPDFPAPNEVYIPFLPVALPNFNFSLSGIWHYVREWISSLGAWFTVVLTIWSNLPYAMVVPVYATMVVLIVLGVYKRFFM